MKKQVEIAMISDRGFFMPSVIALKSLQLNRSVDVLYKIYFFLIDCNEEDEKVLTDLEQENFEIVVKHLSQIKNSSKYENDMISAVPTALYKFDLPDMLPECDKLLYVDGDILIQKDLYSLYSTDIEDYYAAVVKDMPLMIARNAQMKIIDQVRKDYFNSGVMLLNLKKMRQDEITEKLYFHKEHGRNTFMDQDAFNVVFGGNVLYLSLYYNLVFRLVENYHPEELCEFYQMPMVKNPEQFYENATIIHMASSYKPWKYDVPILSELFRKYYDLTIYKEQKLMLEEGVGNKKKVRIIENNLQAVDKERVLFIVTTLDELFIASVLKILTISEEIDCHILLQGEAEKYKDNKIVKNIFSEIKIEGCDLNDEYSLLFFNGLSEIGYEVYYGQVLKGKKIIARLFESGAVSYCTDYYKKDDNYVKQNAIDTAKENRMKCCTETHYFRHLKSLTESYLTGVALPIPDFNINISETREVADLFAIEENKVLFFPSLQRKQKITAMEIEIFKDIAEVVGKDRIAVVVEDEDLERRFRESGYNVRNNTESILMSSNIIVSNNAICAADCLLSNQQGARIIDFSGMIARPESDYYTKPRFDIIKRGLLDAVYRPRNMKEMLSKICYLCKKI